MPDLLDYDEAEFDEPVLGLNRAGRRAFGLLVIGHVLFMIALAVLADQLGDDLWFGTFYIVPLFGLPLAILGPRERRVWRALVLLIGFTAIHYVAVWTTILMTMLAPWQASHPMGISGSPVISGAIGSAVGAVASLLLCAAVRLFRPGWFWPCLIGAVVLTGLGALGFAIPSDAAFDRSGGALPRYAVLYVPWRLAFAYLLARLFKS